MDKCKICAKSTNQSHDLICKECKNTFSSNDIILEGGKESCPHCGECGNIWDTSTQI